MLERYFMYNTSLMSYCVGERLSQNQHRDASSDANYPVQPNYQHVPKQNTAQITCATSGYFNEHANNAINQETRHQNALNQDSEPVTRAAQNPERSNNVDQGSRIHQPASNQHTPAVVTRATTGHIPAVNSPSFFISLPFGRTR